MKIIICLFILLISVHAFIKGVLKSKQGEFYSNTFFHNVLGIYVWGDALILGPFWMVSSLLFLFLTTEWILRYVLIYYFFRSLVEIIYWVNHQVAQREYIPPLFSKVTWLKANESAILYQLMHTCAIVFILFMLVFSFF